MDSKNFKKQIVEKIEEFLRDRMEVFDKFRLKSTTEFLTTKEVYQKYKILHYEEREENPLRIPYYANSKLIGASVVFTKEEKEKIFSVVSEYLMKNNIVKYPNSRRGFTKFIIDIFEIIINDETIPNELKEELSRLTVSLNCVHDFLSLENDYEEFFCNEDGHFYIEDHGGKQFVSYNSKEEKYTVFNEYYVSDFTPLITNDSLKVLSLKGKGNKEDIVFFGTYDSKGYHVFINGELLTEEDYDLNYCISMHEYFTLNDCLFLEKEIYGPNDVIAIIQSEKRFQNMSDEEKEQLNIVAFKAAKFVLNKYENYNFCNNDNQANDFQNGYVSSYEIYEFGQKEKIFIETLKNEIKAKLLKDNFFIRLALGDTSKGIIRRALNESGLDFLSAFGEVDVYLHKIFYRDLDNNIEIIYSENEEYMKALKKG